MAKESWSRAPKLSLWSGEGEGMGRTYVDPFTDGRYPSVTTVLKNTPKADMMGWAAMMVAKAAVERYAEVGGDPEQVMKWLPFAHNAYRDERGWVGSGVHATIQSEHEGTWDFYELDAEQLRMLDNWGKFVGAYQAEILESEVTILGDGYMGTFDAVIRFVDPLTGETHVALIDIKTSKRIWSEAYMQLAALANAECMFREVPKGTDGAARRKGKTVKDDSYWLKEPMPAFDGVYVLHLREDFYDFVEVPHLGLHFKQFMAYRDVLGAQMEIRAAEKGK